MSGLEGMEIEEAIVEGDCSIREIGHIIWSFVEEGQLSLDIEVQSIVKLIDVQWVIVI
jgi:hypothetical protein